MIPALVTLLGFLPAAIIVWWWKRQNLVLEYEGELATAQALNQRMLDGYRVYHDIPCSCGNIDHAVIGQNGIFTVNSKGYSKPQKKNNVATVDYARSKIKLTSRSTAETSVF